MEYNLTESLKASIAKGEELNSYDNKSTDQKSGSKYSLFSSIDTTSKVLKSVESPLKFYTGKEDLGKSRYDYMIYPGTLESGHSLERIRGFRQSGIAQFGGFLLQTVVGEVIGGTFEGLGDLLDFKQYKNLINGTEEEFGNAIQGFGKAIKDWAGEAGKIYRTYDSDFAPWAWSWWMTNAVSFGSTLSLFIPSVAAVKGIDYGAKALRGVLRGVKLLREFEKGVQAVQKTVKAVKAVEEVGKAAKTVGVAEKTAFKIPKYIKEGVAEAVVSRHLESMMEARQRFDESYKELIEKGADETTARREAAKAARKVYTYNWFMLAMDIPQYLTFSKYLTGMNEKALSIAALKQAGKSTTRAVVEKTFDGIKINLSEAFEEFYQQFVQNEGKRLAEIAAFPESDDGSFLNERLGKYAKSGEAWNAAFWGALNAVLYSGAGKVGHVLGHEKLDPQVETIKSWNEQAFEMFQNLKKIKDEGGHEDDIALGLEHAKITFYTKAAQTDTLGLLKDFWTALSKDASKEDLEKLNIDSETHEALKPYAKQIAEDVDRFSELYKNNMLKFNGNVAKASHMASLEFKLDAYSKLQKKYSNSEALAFNSIPNIDKLSPNGKLQLQYETEHALAKKSLEHEKKTLEELKEKEKEGKNVTEREKNSVNKRIEYWTDLEKELSKKLQEVEKNLTEEDKYTSKTSGIDIEHKSVYDYINAAARRMGIELASFDIANDIEFVRKNDGDVLTKEERENLKNKAKENEEKEQTDLDTLEEGDIVEGKNGEKYVVSGVSKDERRVQVKSFDENGIPKDETVKDMSFDEVVKLNKKLKSYDPNENPETVSEDDFYETGEVTGELGKHAERGIGNPSKSISYSNEFNKASVEPEKNPGDYEEVTRIVSKKIAGEEITEEERELVLKYPSLAKAIFKEITESGLEEGIYISNIRGSLLLGRNKSFEEYIANPKNFGSLKDCTVSFVIDLSFEDFWKNHKEIYEQLTSGKELTEDEIKDIIEEIKDNAPIKVIVKTKDGKTFSSGLYIHSTGYSNIFVPPSIQKLGSEAVSEYIKSKKSETQKFRIELLKNLLAGNSVETTGINITSIGKPHRIQGAKFNVNKSFGGSLSKTKLFVQKVKGVFASKDEMVSPPIPNTPVGAIFAVTNKNALGENVLLRVNPEKLSEEHADILFDAIFDFYKKGNGYTTPFKDSRVENLTIGEVITLLSHNGKITSVDLNKGVLGEHMRSKQLYVTNPKESKSGRFELHFGEEVVELYPGDEKTILENKKKFKEWATKNKNYPVITNDAKAGIELNGKLKKSFKLGSLQYDARSRLTYAQFLIKNNLVTTNITEFGNSGSVFHGQAVEFNVDPRISKNGKGPAEPGTSDTVIQKPQEYKEPIQKELPLFEQEQKKEEPKKQEGSGKKEETTKKPDINSVDPSKINRINKGPFTREYKFKEYERQKLTKEYERAASMIGDFPVLVRQNLIRTLKEGKVAFGQFVGNAIVLYSGAEKGTLYHEAFHRVSLTLLSPSERKTLYDEARKEFKEELKKEYGDRETFSDYEVEEFLAEKFRNYTITRSEETIPQKIARFFKTLFERIKSVFNFSKSSKKSYVDAFFDRVYSGKYKYTPVNIESLKSFYEGQQEYFHVVRGANLKAVQDYRQFMSITKGLANGLITINGVTDFKKISNLDFDKLFDQVKENMEYYKLLAEASRVGTDKVPKSEDNAANYERLSRLYQEILDNKDIYIESIDSYLRFQMNLYRVEEDIEEEESKSTISQHIKASYESSARESALSNVKYLLSNIVATEDPNPMTDMYEYVDFNILWSWVINDIHNKENIEEMLIKLEEVANTTNNQVKAYAYKQIIFKLNRASEREKIQFERSLKKYRHNFMNILFSKDVEFVPMYDPDTGQYLGTSKVTHENEITYKFTDANIQKASINVRNRWALAFMVGKVITTTVDGKRVLNQAVIEDAIKTYSSLIDEFNYDYKKGNILDNDVKYVNAITELLNKLGIPIDTNSVLEFISSTATPGESFKDSLRRFIGSEMAVLFKGNTFLKKLNNVSSITVQDVRKAFQDGFITRLSENYVSTHAEEISDTIVGPKGNTYYSFSQNFYLSDYLRTLTLDEGEINDRLKDTYNEHSRLLKALKNNDGGIREKLRFSTFSALIDAEERDSGRGFYDISPVEEFMVDISALNYSVLSNGAFDSMLVIPQFSTKSTRLFLSGLKKLNFMYDVKEYIDPVTGLKTVVKSIPDEILNVFLGYAIDEKNRIDAVKKDIEEAKKNKKEHELINNYHYKQVGKNKRKRSYENTGHPETTPNGLMYHIFKEFNKPNFNFNAHAKDSIKSSLENIINNTKDEAVKLGVVEREVLKGTNEVVYKNVLIDTNLLKKVQDELGLDESDAIEHILADYAINFMYGNIEFEKAFIGDPAQFASQKKTFSTEVDKEKRLGGALSTGDNLVERLSKDLPIPTFRAMTLRTNRIKSVYYKTLYEAFYNFYSKKDADKLTDREIKDKVEAILSDYTDIDPTDATTYISPEMFKSIMIRLGEWEDNQELRDAFEVLNSETPVSDEEKIKALEISNIYMNILKMVYYGMENITTPSGRRMGSLKYIKTSLFCPFRQLVKGTPLEKLLDRMEAKNEFSELQPVEMISYDSAVKDGERAKVDFFETDESGNFVTDEEGNLKVNTAELSREEVVETLKYKWLRYQLPTDPKEHPKARFGLQARRLAMLNIDPNAEYTLRGKQVKGEEVLKTMNTLLSELSKRGAVKVMNSLGVFGDGFEVDEEAFAELMRQDALRANMPDDIIDSIRVENGKLYLSLDSFTNRKWMHSRISRMVAKKTIERELPGGQLIQASNMGFSYKHSNDLKFIKENGNITTMECRVGISLFKDVIPKNLKTHEEKVKFLKENKDVLLGFGYRIPTQGINSMVTLEFVDFLPEKAGDIVVLPNEFTALTGSDFDIDKLFVVRYNLKYNSKTKKLEKIKFSESKDEIFARYEEYVKEALRNKSVLRKVLTKEQLDTLRKIEKTKKDLKNQGDEDVFYEEEYSNMLEFVIRDDFERIKDELVDKKVILSFREFSELPIIEQNSEKAVENMLIENYMSILGDKNRIPETKVPLGKLKGRLKKLASFVEQSNQARLIKGSQIENSLYTYSPSYHMYVKNKISKAVNGIGPFALNNTNHAMAQQVGLNLRIDNMAGGLIRTLENLGFRKIESADDKHTYFSLHDVFGKDGEFISEWLSILIDAHVDLEKDDYITTLNVMQLTYNFTNLLIRGGIGETTFIILTQPALKDMVDRIINTKTKLGDSSNYKKTVAYVRAKYDNLFKEAVTNAEKGLSEAEVKKLKEDIKNFKVDFNDVNALKDNIAISNQRKEAREGNWKYFLSQLEMLDVFESLYNVANNLGTLTRVTNVESSRTYGSSPATMFLHKLWLTGILESGMFENAEKLVNYDINTNSVVEDKDNTFLTTFFKNGPLLMEKLISNFSIEGTNNFMAAVYQIVKMVPSLLDNIKNFSSKDDVNFIKYISDSFFSAIAADFFTGAEKELDDYFSGDYKELMGLSVNMDKKDILNILVKIPEMAEEMVSGKYGDDVANNPFVKQFNVEYAEMPNVRDTITKVLYVSSVKDDKWSRDAIVNGWQNLLSHENEKVRKFANDLFVYAFFTTGFRTGAFSMFSYCPTSLMKQFTFNDKIFSFDDYIRNAKTFISKKEAIPYITKKIREVFLNNTSYSDGRRSIVKTIDAVNVQHLALKDRQGNFPSGLGKAVVITDDEISSYLYIGRNGDGHPVWAPYINIKTTYGETFVYKFVGYTTLHNEIPIYILHRKFGKSLKYSKVLEYGLDSTILQENAYWNYIADDDRIIASIENEAKNLSGFVYIPEEARFPSASSSLQETNPETIEEINKLEDEQAKKERIKEAEERMENENKKNDEDDVGIRKMEIKDQHLSDLEFDNPKVYIEKVAALLSENGFTLVETNDPTTIEYTLTIPAPKDRKETTDKKFEREIKVYTKYVALLNKIGAYHYRVTKDKNTGDLTVLVTLKDHDLIALKETILKEGYLKNAVSDPFAEIFDYMINMNAKNPEDMQVTYSENPIKAIIEIIEKGLVEDESVRRLIEGLGISQELIQLLKENANKLRGVNVLIDYNEQTGDLKNTLGYYEHRTDTITINVFNIERIARGRLGEVFNKLGYARVKNEFIERTYKEYLSKAYTIEVLSTIIHETIHALTLKALHNPVTQEEKDFARAMEETFKAFTNSLKHSAEGKKFAERFKTEIRNIDEFTTYLLTSEDFRSSLKALKYNWFERFILAIARLLHLTKLVERLFPGLSRQEVVNKSIDIFREFLEKSPDQRISLSKTYGVGIRHMEAKDNQRRNIHDQTEFEKEFSKEAHGQQMSTEFSELNRIKESIITVLKRRKNYLRKVKTSGISYYSAQEEASFVEGVEKMESIAAMIEYVVKGLFEVTRIKKEYERELEEIEKEKKEKPNPKKTNIPLKTLYRWHTQLSYFYLLEDVMNILRNKSFKDEFVTTLKNKYPHYQLFIDIADFLENDTAFLRAISDAINTKKFFDSIYESRGIDRLVEYLVPYYTKVRAEFEENARKDWANLPADIKASLPREEYVQERVMMHKNEIEAKSKFAIKQELFKAKNDISGFNSLVQSIMDSPDSISSIVAKAVAHKEFIKEEKVNKKLDELVEIVRELRETRPMSAFSSMKAYYEDIVDIVEVPNKRPKGPDDLTIKTPFLISKFPAQFWTEYNKLRDITILDSGKERKVTPDEFKKIRRDWLNENAPLNKTEFEKAYKQFLKDSLQLGDITQEDYYKLLNLAVSDYGINTFNASFINNISPEAVELVEEWNFSNIWNYREPSERWNKVNEKWLRFKELESRDPNNPLVKLYYALKEISYEADRCLPPSFRLYDRLPGIIKHSATERIIEGENAISAILTSTKEGLSLTADDNERGVSYEDARGNTKYFVPIYYTSSIEERDQNYDLPSIFLRFYEMSLNYKYKSEMVPIVELAKKKLADREIVLGKKKLTDVERIKPGVESNVYQQFCDFINMSVYGVKVKPATFKLFGKEIDATKLLDKIMAYTSINLLSFNVIQGVANVTLGETLQAIEAFAGEYTNVKNFNRAHWMYTAYIPDIIADIGAHKPSNLVSYLNRKFSIMNEEFSPEIRKASRLHNLANQSSLFFLMHAGEHYMQTRFMLSMMMDIKAYDANNKPIKDEKGRHLSIFELMKFENGKEVLDPRVDIVNSKWTKEDQFNFMYKLKGVLSRLHGEYWDLAQPSIQQMALGRLAFQFRKWIVPGYRRRLGKRMYSERLGQFVEGNYITALKFFGNLAKEVTAAKWVLAGAQLKAVFGGENMSDLTEMEIANIRRALLEVLFFLTMTIVSSLIAASLKNMGPDDDDNEWLYSFLGYQAYRLKAEIGFYVLPSQFWNVIRSPAATMSVAEGLGKFLGQLASDPAERFQRGRWKDHLKLEKYAINMVPIIRSFYKLRDVREQLPFFQF